MLGVFPVFGATESQVNPTGFVTAVAVNGSTVASVLVTATDLVVAAAPTNSVRLILLVPMPSSALLLTFKVTGTSSAGVDELGALRMMSPLHTCEVVNLVVLTDTVTMFWFGLPNVNPEEGVALKNPGQLLVWTLTWKF